MLFWLFVILLIVGILVEHFCCKYDSLGEFLALFSGVCIVISLIIMACIYPTSYTDIPKYNERYKALTYKVDSGACRDEFGLLSKDVLDEVQEWNEDIKFYQYIQDNFWLGAYVPNVYDQFETIDYERYSKD